jgi:signal transduction histidine kinase
MHQRPLFWPTAFFLLLAGLVTAVGIVGDRNLRALATSFSWVVHSRSVLDELAALRADVLQTESSSRGFRMTRDRAFLVDYDAARDRSRARLGRLHELMSDNPLQKARLDTLAGQVEEKILFHEAQNALAAGTAVHDDPARSTSALIGIDLMRAVDARIERLRAIELSLLEERSTLADQTYVIARLAGIALAVAALLLGILVFSLFARVVAAQRLETRAQHQRANELNEAVLKATLELERRAQELERSNRDLEQFAFIASHDLQEPLRKISTFADRIDVRHGANLGPEASDSLRRIRSAAGRMQELVENLLEFSRVPRHGRPFAPVDLAPVLAAIEEDLSGLIERTDGRLEIAGLPRVWGDAAHLRQLFGNLVGNGFKFRRDGVPPIVRVQGQIVPPAEAGTAPVAVISVSDNGIGFDPQYSERIFDLFQRLHGRERYEGSGLGLAIARRIAEHHRGRITAEGQPGAGAIFRVELPIPPATESSP